MALIHEQLSRQFSDWEKQGRGWKVYEDPVRPEPPFRKFPGYFREEPSRDDDGRRPTLLSGLYRKLVGTRTTEAEPELVEEDEPDPEVFTHTDVVEFRVMIPASAKTSRETCADFLASLSHCRCPLAFELLGKHNEISVQFACERDDSFVVRRQLKAHFADATFLETESELESAWLESACETPLVVEFGLAREFMFQLRIARSDPFVGLVGALMDLKEGEVAILQILFEPARQNWNDDIELAVLHADGKPFFVNAPELAEAAKSKSAQRLYAAVARVAVLADNFDRTVDLAHSVAASLSIFASRDGNELVPLDNSDYPLEAHIEDLLQRNSRRAGMILTAEELVGLVHLPSSEIRSPALTRDFGKTKRASNFSSGANGVLLGHNTHAGEVHEVRLTADQRVRHMHLIGASGTGKSNLLFNLIRQDILANQGIGVLDPHGDLIDRILGIIPPHRFQDVILIDPSDEQFSVGFNILSAHSDLEKTLLSSDLVGIFQRLSTSWGDQMGSVLRNAILAFLESDAGGTIADLRRFLIEPAFRNRFLETVADPDIVYYWKQAFPQLGGNKSIGSVLTRLETFLAPKPIRYMVSQRENRVDFSQILDSGKILLARLPRGEMGEENSFLLGSFFVAKFQQAAMARQRQAESARRDFWLYLDEFHNFMTPSMAEILSGTRKYRMGLILAHHDMGQLSGDRKVSTAVMSNPFTRVIFRVGDSDSRALESGLSFFEARDLQNLEIGQAVCRIERASNDFNLTIPFHQEYDHAAEAATRAAVIEESRRRYATPRAAVEEALRAKSQADTSTRIERKAPAKPAEPAAKVDSLPIPKQQPPKAPPSPTAISKPPPQPPEREKQLPAVAISQPPPVQEAAVAVFEEEEFKKAEKVKSKIIQVAGALGFSYQEEKHLPDQKRIDLVLLRGSHTLAVEICVTTQADHEVRNVLKCIQFGYDRIFHICQSKIRRAVISNSTRQRISATEFARVQFLSYGEFAKLIRELPNVTKPGEATTPAKTIPGPQAKMSPEEEKTEQEQLLAELRRRLKRDKGDIPPNPS